ncbi:MAG TPA: methyltransferase [Gemmatimonadales bacterium]|nr:methyltransferase [Gemmatimonadales bacterium]
MTVTSPGEFLYRDKKLGDTQAITIATAPDVFSPSSTTMLLLRAARKTLAPSVRSVLDLGCGSGIVAVVLAKHLPPGTRICASDLSEAAVRLTGDNARRHGIAIDCRCGSLFEPWHGERFDLIMDDVAGVAEPLDRISGWYPEAVPSGCGPYGTRWILQVLDEAADHLTPDGQLLFPGGTLAREGEVLERARSRFATVVQLEEQWYPLSEELLAHGALLDELQQEGRINLEKRGSRLCWSARVYLAKGH